MRWNTNPDDLISTANATGATDSSSLVMVELWLGVHGRMGGPEIGGLNKILEVMPLRLTRGIGMDVQQDSGRTVSSFASSA